MHAAKGVDEDEIVERLQKLMDESEGPRDKRWQERYDDIPRAVSTAVKKFAPPVTLDDFRAYLPGHDYVYMPTREHWPAASVNSCIRHIPVLDPSGNPVLDRRGNPRWMKPSTWLDRNRPVEQMTWVPGEPEIIRGQLVSDGGWFDKPGSSCLNLYRPPTIELGDKNKAHPWVTLFHKLYPDDADHCIDFLAHRRQRPEEKINHAIILGGAFGIGKDTLLEGARYAVGPWNFKEISPHEVFQPFNEYVRAVILRVSEARDHGEHGKFDRFQFFERMKALLVTPPDVIRVNEKFIRQYYTFNRVGVIVTANRKDSFYLPADDRRHYVAWSTLKGNHAAAEYWSDFYRWYEGGGYGHVAAYLEERDISSFNPKAPPEKTTTFWEIVAINRVPEDAELMDAVESLGKKEENPDGTVTVTLPKAITLHQVANAVSENAGTFFEFLTDRKNNRVVHYRMAECGYAPIRYKHRDDGLWTIGPKRHVIYTLANLTVSEQYKAAEALVEDAKVDLAKGKKRPGGGDSIWVMKGHKVKVRTYP
jgi:hypothetical protein